MKYARVFLKGGDNPLRWVDVPLNGTFAGFCATVRMQGCITPQDNWNVWIPFDQIAYMVEIETTTPVSGIFFPSGEGRPN